MEILYKDSGPIADVSALDGIVVLYASAFGNIDAHGDIIAPGAYSKTIREQGPGGSNRIKHLWMHWPDMILGRPLELEEDDIGLRVVSKVSKTTLGKDALILYADGQLDEHSVGISAILRDDEQPAIIKEARLWEYSSVTWGANPLTPTVDVKGLVGRETIQKHGAPEPVQIPTPLDKQIEKAGRALHTPGISDELGKAIESWLALVKGKPTHDEPGMDESTTLMELLLLSQSYNLKRKIYTSS